MPARATKTSKNSVRAAGHRRAGRPRAATAAARIYSDLRAEMVSLQRRPGEPISEAEIALSYGVSRTPVREAILKLSDEGLVEIFPQSGIFVSRIPLAALPEAIIIRKALEVPLALWMNLVLPKRRVLEIYLNIAEWGPNGEFGAEAGARYAFGKPARDLTPREAAELTAILPNPVHRSARVPNLQLRKLAGLYERRAAAHPALDACIRPRTP